MGPDYIKEPLFRYIPAWDSGSVDAGLLCTRIHKKEGRELLDTMLVIVNALPLHTRRATSVNGFKSYLMLFCMKGTI